MQEDRDYMRKIAKFFSIKKSLYCIFLIIKEVRIVWIEYENLQAKSTIFQYRNLMKKQKFNYKYHKTVFFFDLLMNFLLNFLLNFRFSMIKSRYFSSQKPVISSQKPDISSSQSLNPLKILHQFLTNPLKNHEDFSAFSNERDNIGRLISVNSSYFLHIFL